MVYDEIYSNESSRLLAAVPPQQRRPYAPNSQNEEDLADEMTTTTTTSTSIKWPQYVAALAATGGALAAGTTLGWTSPVELRLAEDFDFPISEEEFSWIGSMMNLGAAFVCIPIGILVGIWGRKLSMLSLIIPFTIGWALLIWPNGVEMMYAGRFLVGIAGGAFCVAAPMYTSEIAETQIRGSLGTFFQLMVTVGILFSYAVGAGVNVMVLSIICGIIPLIFGGIFVFMPETPTYLVQKEKTESAIKSFEWLRGKNYDYKTELTDLQNETEHMKQNPVSIIECLKRPVTIRALCIGLGLMFFQQMSGINAVIFYSSGIFDAANTGISPTDASIIIGVMQVIATFVSTLVVDKLGRRILLLVSAGVMAICTIIIGTYFFLKQNDESSVADIGWIPVASLCLFIVAFSIGFGPIPWMMMGELFAPDIKGFSASLAGTFNWLLAFVVTKTFSNLVAAIKIGPTFWLFSGLTIVGVVFVFIFVPETKGKSLPEIQFMLGETNKNNTQATPTPAFAADKSA